MTDRPNSLRPKLGRRALSFSAPALVALALLVGSGCVELRGSIGDQCLKPDDCLSNVCSQFECVASPPLLGGGTPGADATTDADVDATTLDARLDALTDVAVGSDVADAEATDEGNDAPVDVPGDGSLDGSYDGAVPVDAADARADAGPEAG